MILSVVFILVAVVVFGTMIRAGLLGAPWVPTFKKTALASIKLAKIRPGEVVYDLGCGDGRWLLAAARLTPGKKFVGYEISVLPFVLAKFRQLFSSERDRIQIKFRNFFNEDLAQADVIYCFGLPGVLKKLEPKLKQELKPGARLVSHSFRMPHQQPERILRLSPKSSAIFLYRY